jgi:hypothetical protein
MNNRAAAITLKAAQLPHRAGRGEQPIVTSAEPLDTRKEYPHRPARYEGSTTRRIEMENLTISEINTLIEALDAWTTASKTSSMLAGIMFGAMVAGASGDTSDAKKLMDKMNDGEDEKQKMREEIAIVLKSKLLRIRDRIEAGSVQVE